MGSEHRQRRRTVGGSCDGATVTAMTVRSTVAVDLLSPSGRTRARRCTATAELLAIRQRVAVGRSPITDPFRGAGGTAADAGRSVSTTS